MTELCESSEKCVQNILKRVSQTHGSLNVVGNVFTMGIVPHMCI
jgi:hypothetical protein